MKFIANVEREDVPQIVEGLLYFGKSDIEIQLLPKNAKITMTVDTPLKMHDLRTMMDVLEALSENIGFMFRLQNVSGRVEIVNS